MDLEYAPKLSRILCQQCKKNLKTVVIQERGRRFYNKIESILNLESDTLPAHLVTAFCLFETRDKLKLSSLIYKMGTIMVHSSYSHCPDLTHSVCEHTWLAADMEKVFINRNRGIFPERDTLKMGYPLKITSFVVSPWEDWWILKNLWENNNLAWKLQKRVKRGNTFKHTL